jgi:hypothetical protein
VCTGVALAYSELPRDLIAAHSLSKRVHCRGGEDEVRFLYRAPERVLPVWYGGQLRIVRWGSRTGQTLPATGWTWRASVEGGLWADWAGESVIIPATLGYEGGVWFKIRVGIQGVLVEDEKGPVVYIVVEPASHYYRIMTKSKRMAVLVGERI